MRWFLVLAFIFVATPASAQTVSVDFTNAQLTAYKSDGTVAFSTKVVLPSGNYYPVPVDGIVRRALKDPIWRPTANMHRDKPGYYKEVYGPREPGNAMGHCKLEIDFDPAAVARKPILNVVRIHGNAQEKDLGLRRSRSCVRIPDSMCPQLLELASHPGTKIKFHW